MLVTSTSSTPKGLQLIKYASKSISGLGATRTSFSRSESNCSCRLEEYSYDPHHRSATLELGASADLEPARALRLPSFMSRGMTLKA